MFLAGDVGGGQQPWHLLFLMMDLFHVFRCSLPSVTKRHVGIARLKMPANFGRTSQEIRFIVLVIASTKEVRICFVLVVDYTKEVGSLFL
jgi:hypothetical protein